MKSHLRLFSFLLAGLIACVSLCVFPVFAASGRIQVYAPATPVAVGDSVTVTITLYCDTGIGSWSFSVNYDSSRLQYVSGADDGGGGRVSFSDAVTSSGVTSKSFYVRFRAIAEGSATVRSGSVDLVSWDFEEPGVSSDSCVITVRNPSDTQGGGDSSGTGGSQSGGGSGGTTQQIVTPPVRSDSSENRLSALSVTGYPISPEFDPEQSAYTLTVPYAQKSVEVVASVLDASARAVISGADELAVGENTVTVTVTAANGDARSYALTVTRSDALYDALALAVYDQPCEFPRDVSELSAIPEGFTADAALCQRKRVLTFVNEARSIRLAILLFDSAVEDAREQIFVYDEQSESFSPYVPTQTAPRTFVILPLPEDVELPAGYERGALFLAETELDAWISEDIDEGVVLVWAAPLDGKADFYFYDAAAGTFTLAFPQSDAPARADAEKLAELEAQIEALKEKNDTLWRTTRYTILIALGVIALVVLSMIVTHVVRRSAKRRAKDGEDDLRAPDPLAEMLGAGMVGEEESESEEVEDPDASDAPPIENDTCEESASYLFDDEDEPVPDEIPDAPKPSAEPVTEPAAPAEKTPATPDAPTGEAKADPGRVRPTSQTRSAVEQIFGGAAALSEEELFRQNNPILDEGDDEIDEDGDRPLYDFHQEEE